MAAAKVAAPKISPVRLEELRDDDAPDFQRGERYDGIRFTRVSAHGEELSGADLIERDSCELTLNIGSVLPKRAGA